jgi:hypothetical protein
MMSKGVIFFGWNRSVPGREQISLQHFQEFTQYAGGLQASGAIDSFEPVLLTNHGGDLNGFFLIRGSMEQLSALRATEEWQMHVSRGGYHLDGMGVVEGVTGEGVMDWMGMFASVLEKYS